MELDTTSVDERVARGIALLDEKVPDWRAKVDPNKLDMRKCDVCIFGQIYGDVVIGIRALDLDMKDGGMDVVAQSRSHPGFQYGILTLAHVEKRPTEQDRIDADFDLLTHIWKRKLLEA
jgi:hypothetical protein